jgi:hypothetical protein
MYHLLIERVCTVWSSSSSQVKLSKYQAGCQTDWFIYSPSFIYVFLFHICLDIFCKCFRKHKNLLSFCDKNGE